MQGDYRERVLSYRTAMSLAAEMLYQGIITAKDYAQIDRTIAKSRELDLCSICCRDLLLSRKFRANMSPDHKAGGETIGTQNHKGSI